MINKIGKPEKVASRFSFGQILLWLAVGLILIGSEVYAQNYEMTFNQRRMGNQIGVEVWLKSLATGSEANIGNMTINLRYNSAYLTPNGNTANNTTDSIKFDVVDSPNPYTTITSPYGNVLYGFQTISANPTQGDSGGVTYKFYGLNVNLTSTGAGYKPSSEGRGSLVGVLVFNINSLARNCDILTGIEFSKHAFAGSQSIIDASGNDVTTQVRFTNQTPISITGITLLSPNGPNQLVNRYPDPAIVNLQSYNNHGYPIYFERSGLIVNPSSGDYGTNRLAYGLQYSLDGGNDWTDIGRVAESTTGAALMTNKNLYRSGEIDSLSATVDNFITQGYGTTALTAGYNGVLRVIWKASENFPLRSENAKIKIFQLDTTSASMATNISSRSGLNVAAVDVCRQSISSSSIILGRLFFVQLDGASSYFRTQNTFSNPTQLTVEAWVNLNRVPNPADVTAAPAILASSAGPTTNDEGAWMLYLDQGIYPAFRCREIEGRGLIENYLAVVKSDKALTASDPSIPIKDAHAANWVHIAATVANNVVTLYVNGEIVDKKINEKSVNIRMLTTQHPIWMGLNPNTIENPNGPNGTFEAKNYLYAGIKEARVWRVALSQDDLRKRMSGVYDPSGAVVAIQPNLPTSDVRAGLELDYIFQGTKLDIANNSEYQYSANPLNYYLLPSISAASNNNAVNFRPDRSHIRLTSPAGGEGVSNLVDRTFNVRWAAYGIGKNTANTKDIQIMLSRDGGLTWFDAIDNTNIMMDKVEVENAQADWEPYRNATITDSPNDLQGLIPVATEVENLNGNYAKSVVLRISGTEARDQYNIYDISNPFTVAPHFAVKNVGNAYIEIPATTNINISNGAGYIEAWIKPYRFPTTEEEFFPIVSKKDPTTDSLHYSFRLLRTGQLQFAVGSLTNEYIRTANSDINKPIIAPNAIIFDSSWVHVGVWFNFANSGQANVKFYINGTVQSSDTIQQQLGEGITVSTLNQYLGYLGYEPGTSPRTFVGELKEIRFWGTNPGGQEFTGNEPSDLTKFIQGALSVRADELTTVDGKDYATNLKAAFIMDNGTFINNGYARSVASYPESNDLVGIIRGTNTNVTYAATAPYVKLIEPIYNQAVPNTMTDLKVRWVGFDYNRNDVLPTFRNGSDATNNADMQYSVKGGGGMDWQPYKYIASKQYSLGYTDAMGLPTSNSIYEFPGAASKSQFASRLNIAKSNPDINGDGIYNDQGQIPATMTNGRLRLRARATQNGSVLEYDNGSNGMLPTLVTETDVFNITPPSNFTLRVLLEGYQLGSNQSFASKKLGESYAAKGLKIKLYTNNANTPGAYVTESESLYGYSSDATAMDPTATPTRGSEGSQFANVPFVFTNISDGRYFVLVDHINHLPVLSRYAAPFSYLGDDLSSWAIESGWDFQNWNGVTDNTITESEAATEPPTIGNKFTAYGNSVSDKSQSAWGNTALHYNSGELGLSSNPMAAMVGGDCVKDGQINAADRARVRLDDGGTANRSDITGDGLVNYLDRNITDRNNNKNSSIPPDLLPSAIEKTGDAGMILAEAPELYNRLLESANNYVKNGGAYIQKSQKYNTTLGGLTYKVTAVPVMEDGYINIAFYIENLGSEFALGHSTFGISYDESVLQFESLDLVKEAIFNNREALGYANEYSSPVQQTKDPISGMRTIEVDYDAYQMLPGQIVPKEKTYLGTLKFKVAQYMTEYSFAWHKITGVLTTDGQNVTGNGIFEPIKSIVAPKTAEIIAPNGGESWRASKLYTISWTKPTTDIPVFIEYSIDNGKSWIKISSTSVAISSQNYNWILPEVRSSECLVRLVNANTNEEIDRSDAMFTISPAPVEIIRPSTLDPIYSGGSSDMIQWTLEDTKNIIFEFSENGDGEWIPVTSSVNSETGETAWVLPVVNTKTASVRMIDANSGEVIATSGLFRILTGNMNFTSPRAGDVLSIGTNKQVRWNYNNISKFDMQFSPDGGNSWVAVSNNVNAMKTTYDWIVPQVKSTNSYLRALWNNDPEMEYTRSDKFSIDGILSIDNNEPQTGAFVLNNPIPNPFSNETKISFTLPFSGNVSVTVFNATGVKVASLVNDMAYESGTYTLSFNSMDLPAGMYFIHLNSGAMNAIKSVMLIK